MPIKTGTIQLDLTERYTFGGYIKRGDNTVLDIAVEAIDTPESIRKAMNTVRRAMTNYAPKTVPITIDTDQGQTAHTQVATSTAGQAADATESATASASAASNQEPDPQPTPAIAPVPEPDKPPEGVHGLVHLRCEGCGSGISTFLRAKQQTFTCRCGHVIDLTKPLAWFHYTCPYCESERWGLTNVEDADISVKCKCGGMVDMQWAPKAKEYRN